MADKLVAEIRKLIAQQLDTTPRPVNDTASTTPNVALNIPTEVASGVPAPDPSTFPSANPSFWDDLKMAAPLLLAAPVVGPAGAEAAGGALGAGGLLSQLARAAALSSPKAKIAAGLLGVGAAQAARSGCGAPAQANPSVAVSAPADASTATPGASGGQSGVPVPATPGAVYGSAQPAYSVLDMQREAANLMTPALTAMHGLQASGSANLRQLMPDLPEGYRKILEAYIPASENLGSQLAQAYMLSAQQAPYIAQQKMLTQADLARQQAAAALELENLRGQWNVEAAKAGSGGGGSLSLADLIKASGLPGGSVAGN